MSRSRPSVRAKDVSYPTPYVKSRPPIPNAAGAQSAPAAQGDDSLATNPSAGLVTESHPPTRRRRGWGCAGVFAVVACLAWIAWPTTTFAQAIGVYSVAIDDSVYASEKWAGFKITGGTGTESGVTVTVSVNGTQVGTPITDSSGNWELNVPGDASYITTASSQYAEATRGTPGTPDFLSHQRFFDVDLTLPLSVYSVAIDDTINAQEKTDGFSISGDMVGGLSSDPVAFNGVAVTVTIGTDSLSATSDSSGDWSVLVDGGADYITEPSVSLSVTATLTGYVSSTVTRTLPVDLTAPTVSYTAPESLKVSVVITSITPTTIHTDIDSYTISDGSLPPELALDRATGVISGAPTTASASTREVKVLATDAAGNETTETITFPMVDKGDQNLDGFGYSESRITFDEDPLPRVNRPSGARTPVTYSAVPETVCRVGSSSGSLTIQDKGGICTITASAPSDNNYNAATDATFVLEVARVTIEQSIRMAVPEGGSSDYTVVLITPPQSAVTIYVNPFHTNDTDLAASPDSLTFTDQNWDTPQTVTVSAAEDDDGASGLAQFDHSAVSTDSVYHGISISRVRAEENDNDEIGVTISPTTVTMPDGGSASYTVKLNTPPAYPVTIDVTADSGSDADLTPTPDELTFTDSNWSMAQTVTVSAAPDDDRVDGVAIFSHSVRSDDSLYDNFYTDTVTAIEDETRPRVEIQTEASDPVSGAFEVTIRFSERVEGFELEDIEVSNATASKFNRLSSRTYTIAITPEETGEVRVEVGSYVARDRVDNGNRSATPLVIEADLAGPEVTIISETTGLVGGPFEVTITFSEVVVGFEVEDIRVNNGRASNFTIVSPQEYTATITPEEPGEVKVEVGADVAEDEAGNGNTAAEPFVIEADLAGPEVTIISTATGTARGPFEVTITFSEAVVGFEVEDIGVNNGTASNFSIVSPHEYTATIAPEEPGEVKVEVRADVTADEAGNGNAAAEPFVIEADLAGPEVTIISAATGIARGSFEVTITFSEAVVGFQLEDIQIDNGTASNFTIVSPQEYTAMITPEESGEVKVAVGADLATDEAGNGNTAAEPFVIEADLAGPEVTIISETTGLVGGPFEVTITFSEAVVGFQLEDIQVDNGTASNFIKASPKEYTATITPEESGEVKVEVWADLATDEAGNGNRSARPFVIEADLTFPEVTIISQATGTVEGPFEVTITFSEAVTGFEQSEIEVTNGSVTRFSGSGTSYSAEITPTESGEVTVGVEANVTQDRVGNGNRAAEPIVFEADLTFPEVTIISEATGMIGGSFEVTITFSEPVEGFEFEDLQVTNGTVSNFIKVSPQEFTATITPEETGEVRVEIGEDVVANEAGNGNVMAEPFVIEAVLQVSFESEIYTATEIGEPVTVKVMLSRAVEEEMEIPIRVTRPESTEVDDYTVEGLEGWEVEEGAGKLIIGAGETEGLFKIQANSDEDVEDETLELGFGELPEIVLVVEPALATVTLKDVTLVELKVSFGQADYMIMEGQQADIEIKMSPRADRRVEVPLVVVLQGGTTPGDYSGVPAMLVFEEGESQKKTPVDVLADEVGDPGEGIVLSLGGLPEGVSAGDPSTTEVHFAQHRTAEQFSQTLEGMLAVIVRSTVVSAQTAIEGRFERHRQWSRLGPSASVGAVPAPQSGSDNSAMTLSPGESKPVGSESVGGRGAGGSATRSAWGAVRTNVATGSGWNSENREASIPGSWLRNVSLGSLGNMTGYGMSDSGFSNGFGRDRLQGSVIKDMPRFPESVQISARRNQEFNLSGVSFEMSLGESEKMTSWVPVLWGQGDLQHFSGDLTRVGMNYRGGLEAAHVGLDLYANDEILVGLSFMRSWGNMDYTEDGTDGELESRMNTFHPYLYWQPNERVSVWGIGGLGRGQVNVTEPGRTHDFDADFQMFAGGMRTALSRGGSNEWGLRADAFTTQLETVASVDIAKVSGEAHRSRLMLEWVYGRTLSEGRLLSLKAEAGGRFDKGDADRGSGVETGFRMGYLDANCGLDMALHGRVLVVHESEYRDWGVGVQASWDPGEKQRGFRVSVTSSRGRDDGGRTTLWNNADAVLRRGGMGTMDIGSPYRMESEAAYAGIEALRLPGLLMPYSRLRWTGQGRELALGTAWSPTARPQIGRLTTFELEGLRREGTKGRNDHGLILRMSISL